MARYRFKPAPAPDHDQLCRLLAVEVATTFDSVDRVAELISRTFDWEAQQRHYRLTGRFNGPFKSELFVVCQQLGLLPATRREVCFAY